MKPRRAAIVAFAAVGAVSLLVLGAVGSGTLAVPSSRSWSGLERWYDAVGPASAALVVIRVVAMLGAAWLVLASALQLAVSVCPDARLRSVADSLSPRVLRGVARGAAGLSLTAGLTVPVVPAGPPGEGPGTAVMVPLDVPEASTTSSLPPTASPTTTSAAPATPVPVPPRAPAPADDEVVVASGDSFWSIAVDEATGDVVSYWRQLIDLNRDRLVDPANEDLLYPGQVLRLP